VTYKFLALLMDCVQCEILAEAEEIVEHQAYNTT